MSFRFRCSKFCHLLVVLILGGGGTTVITRVSSLLCVDNEVGFAEFLATNGIQGFNNGCADAIEYCDTDSQEGRIARRFCCDICGANDVLVVGNTNGGDVCADDEAGFAEVLATNGVKNSVGCADAIGFCDTNSKQGRLARRFCCSTCGADTNNGVDAINTNTNDIHNGPVLLRDDPPVSSLPSGDKPLELFLLGGQSECEGKASSADLYRSSDRYPELQRTIEGVWFAGYQDSSPSPETFFIAPLSADIHGGDRFGPEVSFGERIRSATGGTSDVMMVKYCVGGTDVSTHWNPDTAENGWDKTRDDGTAEWLEAYANLEGDIGNSKYQIKRHQFVVRDFFFQTVFFFVRLQTVSVYHVERSPPVSVCVS